MRSSVENQLVVGPGQGFLDEVVSNYQHLIELSQQEKVE
jgi:hypothetical protein